MGRFPETYIGTVVYSKTLRRRPCWCSKQLLWELNSSYVNNFFCSHKFAQMLAKEKLYINVKNNKRELSKNGTLRSFPKLQLQSLSILVNLLQLFPSVFPFSPVVGVAYVSSFERL